MSNALHPIEQKVLAALKGKGWVHFDDLVRSSGLHADQVRRSIEWLSTKRLVDVHEEVTTGLSVSDRAPPETILIERLQRSGGSLPLGQLKGAFESEQAFSAALGRARAAGWVSIDSAGGTTTLRLTPAAETSLVASVLEMLDVGVNESSLSPQQKAVAEDLIMRGFVSRTETRKVKVSVTEAGAAVTSEALQGELLDHLTPGVLSSGEWTRKKLRPIDVAAEAPRFYPGRTHPVREFIREVREAYVSMGFEELEGGSVQPAFWNFDALYIPQDHPGRDMQDTYYLKGFRDKSLRREGAVANVASVHEGGWKTGSRGWGYSWDVEEARRLVLRTHNTVLTIKSLSQTKNEETRVFAVSRVYRNENLDYKHLSEFHQMDGIIVGEGLTLRHLMGFLVEFYKKLGMKDVKFWPTYFPYTEPSLQVMAYSEAAGDWIEMGGSGLFRPEVTRPLGVAVPVLAWGPGLERLMLFRFGLKDLRQLYDGDLRWLRGRAEYASSEA